ncbi:1-acyl-sn-glycerol-3-phosphate acyltransferase [Thermobifida halotolerans]
MPLSLYEAAKVIVAPTTRALWPPRVEGLHHVPERGPVILACNHLSNLDPLFLGVVVPRPIVFIAKKELFAEGNPAQRTFTRALRAIGQVSVDRRPGQSAREAMDHSLAVLAGGRVFGIFPEGTRSPDGRLYKGQTGLAWLALTSGAPVVPAALAGTDRIMPAGRRVPRAAPDRGPLRRAGGPVAVGGPGGPGARPAGGHRGGDGRHPEALGPGTGGALRLLGEGRPERGAAAPRRVRTGHGRTRRPPHHPV